MSAAEALIGICAVVLFALVGFGLHTLQMRLERWANARH